MDIILIGYSSVGKSTIMKLIDKNPPKKDPISTIGLNIVGIKFKPKADPEKEVSVTIWDTAG